MSAALTRFSSVVLWGSRGELKCEAGWMRKLILVFKFMVLLLVL